jgi:hypothetical protein
MAVPYFVWIGVLNPNKINIGARGYQLFRRGRTIISRWGRVVVLPGRMFRWIWRREKRYSLPTEAAAKASYKQRLKQRLATSERLPVGASIMPCAKRLANRPVVDDRWYRQDVPALPWWPEAIRAAQEVSHYTFDDGQTLARIRYGDEEWGTAADERSCYDCAVIKGQYHVGPDCAVEQCPRCGNTLAECDCDFLVYGTAEEYWRAFGAVRAGGIPEKQLALLRAHFAAPFTIATWAQLAAVVGYANGSAVKLQYGRLGRRLAEQLGVNPTPNDFWHVLAYQALDPDETSGQTMFGLRQPVIEALQRLGILSKRRKHAE